MTKKRLFFYVGLGLLLIFLLGTAICFIAGNSVESIKFNEACMNTGYGVFGHEFESPEDYIESTQSVSFQYPYFAVVYDCEGNAVAQTDSYIKINHYGVQDTKTSYVYLGEYLTDEMKRELTQFMDKNGYTVVSSFTYNLSGEKMIPVKLGIEGRNDSTMTLEFSSDEAEFALSLEYAEQMDTAQLVLYDIDEEHYNRKVYDELRHQVLSAKEKALVEIGSASGGGSLGGDIMYYTSAWTFDGQEYVICEAAARRPVLSVLHSGYFANFMWSFFVGFALLGAVLLVAVNILYNRNKKMENARIAFTSAAAHELKTPLAVISNLCECIMENVAPEKNSEYISSVYSETVRMNRLVKTLLDYNRVNAASSVEKEECNLEQLAANELEKYLPQLSEKGIEIQTKLESTGIKCNAALISLVIDNFLSNALKYTPENGKVRLTVSKEKGKTRLTVFNSGSSIDSSEKENIWDEFYRMDKARNSEDNSSGMGLAICRKILQLHGFAYGCRNIDDGVEFYFSY